jgi:RNA polymerase sigma factor (sigma-70 family)
VSQEGRVEMTLEPHESDLIAAIKRLEATSATEQDEAVDGVYHWLRTEVRNLLAKPAGRSLDLEHDIAADVTRTLMSERHTRQRVLEARSPPAFLRRVILNAVYDRYRRAESPPLTDASRLDDENAPRSQEIIDAADAVAYVFEQLSDEEQELLGMRFWEELPYRAIAHRLGISYHAAAKRLHRLLHKLRTISEQADLPAPQAEILCLSAAGLTTQEIAGLLDLPTGAKTGGVARGTGRGKELPTAGQRSDTSRAQLTSASERFQRLAAAWRANRGPTSSLTELAMRPEYQQIIGMGTDAVPLLLQELQRELDHWFWALVAITGEDPVGPEHKGKLSEMRKVWVQWGKDRGYLQSNGT